MRTIAKLCILFSDQAKIGFVHQRGRLQRVPRGLSCHAVPGKLTELVIGPQRTVCRPQPRPPSWADCSNCVTKMRVRRLHGISRSPYS